MSGAQKIRNLLKELQIDYLQKNKESTKMFKRLQEAIEMLNNKRKLFDIGQVIRYYDSEDEDQKSPLKASPLSLKMQLNESEEKKGGNGSNKISGGKLQ